MSMNLHLECLEANGEVFDSFSLSQTPTKITNEILGEGVWTAEGKEPYLSKYLLWYRGTCDSYNEYEDFREYESSICKWIAKREKYVTGCKFEWYKL